MDETTKNCLFYYVILMEGGGHFDPFKIYINEQKGIFEDGIYSEYDAIEKYTLVIEDKSLVIENSIEQSLLDALFCQRLEQLNDDNGKPLAKLISEFLDYHFWKYRGEAMKWLQHVEILIENSVNESPASRHRHSILVNWINEQKKILTHGGISVENDGITGLNSDVKSLSAAQYLLIEYFTEGKLGNNNPSVDNVIYYRYLAKKYGKNEESYKKALTRVNKIIDFRITDAQKRDVKNDLEAISNYFKQTNQSDLTKKVEDFAKRISLHLFE